MECTDVIISVISKAALTAGMSNLVPIVYSNAIGTLILLPYFIFFRKKEVAVSLSILWRFFLLALIGSTGQMIYLTGIKFSSPSLSSAIMNLIPIFVFLMAIIFRMEKVDLRRSSSQAKIFGTMISVTGALVATLYKGPAIFSAALPSNLPLFSEHSMWIIGGSLLLLTAFSSATWNIAQTATVKLFPDEMTIVFFFTFFITIQAAIFALVLERDPEAWRLKSSIEVIAIVSTALLGSLFRISIQTWCLRKKGPVYVVMFKPLGIIVAVVMTVAFLGEILHLGSVIGSVIIAVGFYGVMWGKTKEKNSMVESSGPKSPLLQSSEIV